MLKRPFSLRVWILAGIVGLVVVPYVLTWVVLMTALAFEPQPPTYVPVDFDQPEIRSLIQAVESNSSRWEESEWRATILPALQAHGLRVELENAQGHPVYRSPDFVDYIETSVGPFRRTVVWHDTFGVERRDVEVYDAGRLVGRAIWFEGQPGGTAAQAKFNQFLNYFMPVTVGILILGTIWGAVALASRAILAPLKALSAASRQINGGDLEFSVPTSSIKEVNEFARAFDQMRAGLEESVQKQAALEQERKLFISAVAHDLRTPLASVRGYLEGLRDGVAATEEKRTRYVAVALEKTATLEHLIESFFAFTKTEYLGDSLQREELDLGALLKRVTESFEPAALSNGIHLRLEEPPAPCTATVDRLMISRVVSNLLENALRYTHAGGTVRVGWRAGLSRVQFWVADSGPGIPAEDMGRVFQPLYRGDKARGSATGGAGLGLAIAARLVQAHNGTITVQNQNGAIFIVTINT